MQRNILVIGDTHIPFEHKNYLAFCKETQKKFKCDTIIHIGDLVDNHAISFHDKDPDGRSASDEIKLADRSLKKWYKAFPKVQVVEGNHCNMVARKAFKHYLPKRCFKNFHDIWNLPTKWEYAFDYFHYGIRFFHGMGYGGKYAHKNAINDNRCSVVMGHLHSNAGVEWTASERDILFGMAVGCGIDRNKYAFNYGRDFARKPILGAGVVLENGKYAQFIPMKL